MIIVRQFEDGEQGRENVLGVIDTAPTKLNTSTRVSRSCCVSDFWKRETIYIFKVAGTEYVVEKNGKGNFELFLGSEDPVPPGIKDYCSCCERLK